MSISYYGVATADRDRIGALVEGTAQPDIPRLDVKELYRTLTTRTSLRGPENGTLRWDDDDGGYVFVDLSPTCVLVTQSTSGSDEGIDVIIDITSALNSAGVNVYDPQQGSWFPGSPVKAKPAPKAKPARKAKKKPKANAKAKAKAKPKAKARPTKKPKAASRPRKRP